jgi:hypothetical protein
MVRFAKCKTQRIVSKVKNSFITVFSVLQNLAKLTWFIKKKIYFYRYVTRYVLFYCTLFGNFTKKIIFKTFFSQNWSVCDIQHRF